MGTPANRPGSNPRPLFNSIGRAIVSLTGRDLLLEFEGVADRIQRSLLDVAIPPLRGIEVGVRAAPARLVGGDYVDVIERPGHHPLFAIGDVSGKSLPAALRAMMLKYLTRGLASVLDDDLTTIVTRANEIVCSDIEPDAFVTFCVATLSDDNRVLRLANAGHDPPLIHRSRSREIEQLDVGALAMGIESNVRYSEQTAALGLNDLVVFYTDGFTEAKNPDGDQFTLAQVKDGLAEYADLPAQQLADALFEQIEAFSAGTLNDDATILIIRVLD
jgi:sigma-B regulation protein RsbU (phosphoserine phosphatase)